ncbi:hypothetical protein IGI04_040049 [Brassica rapa subsp. trilocularis]|uniref:Uncharacterized protein n=1 Tax=Brassica rapa subsp. trilocularis TaxID=1813537 RepID=A0ABQ7KMJ2_BRACM|nr:hypothetical protein IGI04_040049 [Brassica rapa subsp. trilocularis]
MGKKSKKNEKNYQRSNGQLVETNELDRPAGSSAGFNSAVHRAGSTTGFISAVRRAGSTTGIISAVRRAGPVLFGERPSWINHRIQFGERPSWIEQNPSSPCHCSSSPEIVPNLLFFCLDRRYLGTL